MEKSYRGELLVAAHPGSGTANLVRTLKADGKRVHYERWNEARRDVPIVVSYKYIGQANQFDERVLWVREPIATVYSAAVVLAEGGSAAHRPHGLKADGPFFRELHELFGSPVGPHVKSYEATLHSVVEMYERCRSWEFWRAEDFLPPGVNSHNKDAYRPWSWLVDASPDLAERLARLHARFGYSDPRETYPY